MAKIALELKKALADRAVKGLPNHPEKRILAQGPGWAVADALCTSGPQDRPFEERHEWTSIAIVVQGSFQYRAGSRHVAGRNRELMTPGSVLLGNVGQAFECSHTHSIGDRCVSFRYAPEYFEQLASEIGLKDQRSGFRSGRLPPLRPLSPLVARVCAGLAAFTDGVEDLPWEELGIQLAARTMQIERGVSFHSNRTPAGTETRVTEIVKLIERSGHLDLGLEALAKRAGLSRYHFLRTFQRLTGVTPHQYVLRARIRKAATSLLKNSAKVLDVAQDCGFRDLSNFNHAFRAEFGVAPRAWRLAGKRRCNIIMSSCDVDL